MGAYKNCAELDEVAECFGGQCCGTCSLNVPDEFGAMPGWCRFLGRDGRCPDCMYQNVCKFWDIENYRILQEAIPKCAARVVSVPSEGLDGYSCLHVPDPVDGCSCAGSYYVCRHGCFMPRSEAWRKTWFCADCASQEWEQEEAEREKKLEADWLEYERNWLNDPGEWGE